MVTQSHMTADRSGDLDGRANDRMTVSAALGELAYAVAHPLRSWDRRRRMVAALSRLDDCVLEDIGIDPWDIRAVARTVVARNLPKRRRIPAAIGDLMRACSGAWQTWRQRQATMNALARLDDRMLHDIGLNRGMIGIASLSLGHIAADHVASFARPGWRSSVLSPAAAPSFPSSLPSSQNRAQDTGETANDNRRLRAS